MLYSVDRGNCCSVDPSIERFIPTLYRCLRSSSVLKAFWSDDVWVKEQFEFAFGSFQGNNDIWLIERCCWEIIELCVFVEAKGDCMLTQDNFGL